MNVTRDVTFTDFGNDDSLFIGAFRAAVFDYPVHVPFPFHNIALLNSQHAPAAVLSIRCSCGGRIVVSLKGKLRCSILPREAVASRRLVYNCPGVLIHRITAHQHPLCISHLILNHANHIHTSTPMSQPRGRGRGGPGPGGGPPRGRGAPTHFRGRGGSGPVIYNTGQPVQIDPNVSASTELIQRLRTANPGPERPARPGYGTAGRVVALRANFFALENLPETIYEYVVQITPEPKSQKPRVKRRVLALFEQTPDLRPFVNDIAHDGAQRLVASKPLPEPLRDTVTFYEEGDARPPRDADKYTVEVSFFKELATEPLRR